MEAYSPHAGITLGKALWIFHREAERIFHCGQKSIGDNRILGAVVESGLLDIAVKQRVSLESVQWKASFADRRTIP